MLFTMFLKMHPDISIKTYSVLRKSLKKTVTVSYFSTGSAPPEPSIRNRLGRSRDMHWNSLYKTLMALHEFTSRWLRNKNNEKEVRTTIAARETIALRMECKWVGAQLYPVDLLKNCRTSGGRTFRLDNATTKSCSRVLL